MDSSHGPRFSLDPAAAGPISRPESGRPSPAISDDEHAVDAAPPLAVPPSPRPAVPADNTTPAPAHHTPPVPTLTTPSIVVMPPPHAGSSAPPAPTAAVTAPAPAPAKAGLLGTALGAVVKTVRKTFVGGHRTALDGYDVRRVLGSGTFGKVVLAEHRVDKKVLRGHVDCVAVSVFENIYLPIYALSRIACCHQDIGQERSLQRRS